MRIVNNVVVFLLAAALFMPMVANAQKPAPTQTIGNFSYIPLERRESAHNLRSVILNLLDKFEKDHCFRVVSYSVEKQYNSYARPYDSTFGIWVTHEPREAQTCKADQKK